MGPRSDNRGYGGNFGDATGMVLAFPSEYAELQREYPIFFRKDRDSGEWQSVALLGFEQHENLFLQDGRWNASYLPGAVARGPFLIGFQEQRFDGESRKEPVIHVDPPPSFQVSPFQVSPPGSSGLGIE